MKREIKITSDGSHTLYVPELDEHYHSIHGAIQESMHVFITNGIQSLFKSPIKVLEVGFGTGLNALLTAIWSNKENIEVHYIGIESTPLEMKLNESLNYSQELDGHESTTYFDKIISSNWHIKTNIHDNFTLNKIASRIQDYRTDDKFDIIYFDAFGPEVQEELWELRVLKNIYELLNNNGIFVTYCAKGQLKRDLKELGFKVESLPGPPGKREMTRAVKF
ncbi:MAG: tRNA (5-methylaminomethyl-2-thiouridine)(34)-methyltransferase MnmD [Crocinitomicaceae bacterium]|nr:tRNA (5-methylaminomethyl-2-thiouridine)(34)-methyltransferase MnmD [Crocinitomicaceae bacterium]